MYTYTSDMFYLGYILSILAIQLLSDRLSIAQGSDYGATPLGVCKTGCGHLTLCEIGSTP